MDAGDIFLHIRKLSNSNYYQSIYNLENKNFDIQMFRNRMDLSPLQIVFLNYLGLYSSLHIDVSLGEVDRRVFENEIYEDAYLYYKQKVRNADKKERKKQKPRDNNKGVTSQWIFKTPKKVNK